MAKLTKPLAEILIGKIFKLFGGNKETNPFAVLEDFSKLFPSSLSIQLAQSLTSIEIPDVTSYQIHATAQEDFNQFFIGTLFGRLQFLAQNKKPTVLRDCLKETLEWLTTHEAKLISLWQARHNALAWMLKSPHQDSYLLQCTQPLFHNLQFAFLAGMMDEKYHAQVACYTPLHYRSDAAELRISQLSTSPVLVRHGPTFMSFTPGLTSFLDDVTTHDCGLIIACGYPYPPASYLLLPAYQINSNDLDFLNYFGAECPAPQQKYFGQLCTLYRGKVINPKIDDNGQSNYQSGPYKVTTQKQYKHIMLGDSKDLFSHDVGTYTLQLQHTQRPIKHSVVVHNLLVPDSNPARLNQVQLELLYKSVIKACVEGRKILIHCAAGVGRSGEIAFILARLLIQEMPKDPIKAVQWLRKYRQGLVANYEQLADAEKLANEMLAIHQTHLSGIKEGQNPWQYVYEKLKLKDWIATLPATQAATATAGDGKNDAGGFWQAAPPMPTPPPDAGAAAATIPVQVPITLGIKPVVR